jgi:hypothetical protein
MKSINLLKQDLLIFFQNLSSSFLYWFDEKVKVPRQELGYLPREVKLRTEFDPTTKSFLVTWKKHPEIFVSSNSTDRVIKAINVALLDYFDVTNYHTKKLLFHYKPDEKTYNDMKAIEGKMLQKEVILDFSLFQDQKHLSLA